MFICTFMRKLIIDNLCNSVKTLKQFVMPHTVLFNSENDMH